MVQRKGAKGKKDAKMAGSFADFMAQATKNSGIIDLSHKEEKFYKFGDYNLDRALGGGIAVGSVVSLQGPSSSGKSISALQLARDVVDQGGRVAYFDTENKISKKAISRMGLTSKEDADGLPLFNHLTMADNNLEDLLQQIINMAESGFFKLLVIDSVDSLQTNEQEEREIGDSKVGGYKAKILSEVFPQIIAAIQRGGKESDDGENATLVLVRQVRDNPGALYSSPEVTSGGRSIEFYSTTVLRFGPNKSGNSEEDGKLVYQGATVTPKKHNQGALVNKVEIRYYIGDDPNKDWGIDPLGSIVDEAIALRIIPPKSATSHMYIGCDELCEKLGVEPGSLNFNGKNNLVNAIQTDDAFQQAIIELIDERADMDPMELDADVTMDFEELED